MARGPRTILSLQLAVLGSFIIVGQGCGRRETPAVQVVALATPVPSVSRGNAFDAYIKGADLVEATHSPLLKRTFFYAKQRRDLVQLCNPAVRLAMNASNSASFPYAAHGPFAAMPHGQGWRLMGLAFSISIEEFLNEKDYANAVTRAIAGTRFGLNLCGGGAMEADLGLQIVDDCRRAILKSFALIPADQLRRLGQGVKSAWLSRPAALTMIEHEGQQMESCLTAIEAAAQSKNFSEFDRRLGKGGAEVSQYLLAASQGDTEKFLSGLREEMRERLSRARELAALSVADRKKKEYKEFPKSRPWRRYAWHYFLTLDPLLPIWDASMARTCMLVLACELEARRREKRNPPASLAEFSPELTRDPFTGQTFIYRANEANYVVYSVGEDLIDNGGPSQGAYTRPDLGLEREAE